MLKLVKKIILSIFVILLNIVVFPSIISYAQDTSTSVKILFIGNSSTYYNSMPLMIEGLAQADDMECKVTSITASNYKLSQFATTGNTYNTKILNTLKNEKFDYVILQEHRENIMQNIEKTKESITTLKKTIDNSGAETILYETQADRFGRDFIVNNTSIFFDNETLQYYMNKHYYYLSSFFECRISPAGVNYTRSTNEYPEINLYNSDMRHPSLEGSYLAACTLYQTIFNKSPFGNKYLPKSDYEQSGLIEKLNVDNAVRLQNIADATLNLSKYSIELKKGKASTLDATLKYNENNPAMEKYSNKIDFSSLDDKIVGVNRKNGTITALNVGETMLMASTDSGLMSLCRINIIQPAVSMTISEGTLKLHRKDKVTYKATLSPDDTTDKITWSSSKPSIVAVDQTGTITAKKIGIATITAVTDSGIKLTRSVRVRLITPTKLTVKSTKGATRGKKYKNVKITWKKNTNAVKYYVYRSTKKGSGYKQIATTTSAKYTDKNKKKGKVFYYKIRSIYSDTRCNSLRTTGKKITIK